MNQQIADSLAELEQVLDRARPIPALKSLSAAIINKPRPKPDLNKVALGIDASVFLKLSTHKSSADIIDYLSTKHSAPIVLPGQAIQEFWNNHLSAVDTTATGLRKKVAALAQDISNVDKNFGDFADRFESVLKDFSSEYGHLYDENTIRATSKMLEVLEQKASLTYVPRLRFQSIAASRKQTKTPPGFKDPGDGDFYIWIEFLFGLQLAKKAGRAFDHAILLTNDQKIDWSRGGVAHPILAAEAMELLEVPFDVWTIDQLAARI